MLVIGAGPIGSYAALSLARLGYRVMVFERRPDVGLAVCCTGIVGKECLDRFPDANNAVVAEVNSTTLFSPTGRPLRLEKETAQAYVVDRPQFDKALAARAKGDGAEYMLSANVVEIVRRDRCVEVTVERDAELASYTGRVAILSTGFGGPLAEQMGLGKIKDFVVGAQARVQLKGLNEIECYFGQTIAPGFFAWLVPTSPGYGLVGLLTRRKSRVYLERLLSRLSDEGKIDSHDPAFTYGGIPLLPLRRTYAERVVVVGDAAGHAKPTTGGGVYYGLLGARAAANVLDSALRADDLSPRSLARYETEWRAVLAKELQLGYLARRMYENLSDSQIDRIFQFVERTGIHEELLRAADSSFDWHAGAVLKALRDSIRFRPDRPR